MVTGALRELSEGRPPSAGVVRMCQRSSRRPQRVEDQVCKKEELEQGEGLKVFVPASQ